MKKKLVKKIACECMAAALVLSLTACGGSKDDTSNSNDNQQVNTEAEYIEDDYTEDSYDEDSYSDDDYDYEEDDYYEDEEPDYTEDAENILSQIDEFLTATKNGDMETFMSYVDPSSEEYEDLEKLAEYDPDGELFKILYGRMVWTFTDDNKEELTDSLEYHDGVFEEYGLNITLAKPHTYLGAKFYEASLEEGTEYPDDYYPESEEAKAIVEKIYEISPLVYENNFYINYSDGQVSVITDDTFWDFDMLHIDDVADGAKKGGLFRRFISENYDVEHMKVAKDAAFDNDDEHHRKALDLIEAKDIQGIKDLYIELAGNYEKFDLNAKEEDLTDEQLELLNDVIANEMDIKRSYLASNFSDGLHQRGYLLVTVPAKYSEGLLSEEEIEWLDENDVKDVWFFGAPLTGQGNTGAPYSFLLDYHHLISIIKDNY